MSESSPEFSHDVPDGVRWLTMCGRADTIGKWFTLPSGRTIQAEQFPEVSEQGAQTMFTLEKIQELFGTDHPLYQEHMPQAQGFITKYFGPPPEQQ